MKPKTLILMVVAVVCGLGASYMTSRLLAERSMEEEQPQVMVLVAKKNLDMGQPLKNPKEIFTKKAFILGEEPKNAIKEYDELKERVLKRSLREGDFVSKGDLLDRDQVGISARLPKGMRAIGLRVNMEAIAGGFASLPHSRVDIISTFRRGDDKNSFSQVLLQNVLVLAADTNPHRDENNRAMPASVVTVALKPEDVLKVKTADTIGTLSLMLRKFNDNAKVDIPKVTVEQVMTNTAGKNDEILPSGEDDGGDGGPVIANLDLPKLPDEAVAPPQPLGRVHRIRVIDGGRVRYQEYLLDNDNQVIYQGDVVRSDPRNDRKEEEAAPPEPKLPEPTGDPRLPEAETKPQPKQPTPEPKRPAFGRPEKGTNS